MNFNERHLAWLKFHCPFYDSYVLLDSKEKEKPHDCVIDRRFTKLSYQVFSMILEESTLETFEENLRRPEDFIKRAKNIRRKRGMKYDEKTGQLKTKLIHSHVKEDYRTEGVALASEGTEAVKASLADAYEILFNSEVEEMPLYANAGWQFCIDLRYNAKKIGEAPKENPIAKFPEKIEDFKKKVGGVFKKSKEETEDEGI